MMTLLMADALLPQLSGLCEELGHPLQPSQLEQFQQFRDALYRWNLSKNLTRVPQEECERRHFCESCLVLDLIEGIQVLDIGTGPGFPAWPLACARPDLNVTAIDSNGKMLEFLRSQPLLNLKVVEGRTEEMAWRESFDTVTGRALAPLTIQLEVSAQACRIGGRVIPFRTENDDLEPRALVTLGLELVSVERRDLGDGMTRVFPIYEKVRQTPAEYPRPWATIKRKPMP